MPEIDPRGPVGPDAPLSDIEKKEFTKRMVVEVFTAAAVQAACERAFNEGIPVLFPPAHLWWKPTSLRTCATEWAFATVRASSAATTVKAGVATVNITPSVGFDNMTE